MNHPTPTDAPMDFQFQREQLQTWVTQAMDLAKQKGAYDVAANISEGVGLNVSVRCGELENIEHHRDKSLAITVYLGASHGSASTSDFSTEALERTVQAALDIAKYTAADPEAALPDPEDVSDRHDAKGLALYHPWHLNTQTALDMALACEQAAFETNPLIINSEGASVSTHLNQFFSAQMRQGRYYDKGIFYGGYPTSRHSISVSPIAGKNEESMQRDYWYSSHCNPTELHSVIAIGQKAAQRAVQRLGARRIPTTECPILFDATVASGLISSFIGAISGGSLYRQLTFLPNSLGQQVMADHLDLDEDPFIPQADGSSPFDGEGVTVQARRVMDAGVVQGYFLGSYSARKLNMRTTGHSGGAHNLVLRSRHTQAHDDLQAMLAKLGTGLYVTELMGQGVNGVTGDYSRGAAGFWVENGEIIHPVQEVTIASNLKTMFKGIQAVGSDTYCRSILTLGSILIDKMVVAGE